MFDFDAGETASHTVARIAAAAVDGNRVAMVEEPIVYHDERDERGSYRLHVGSV